jgi:hypothetical protein
LVYDRLYDSEDYVFDFTPFWPITNRVINATWGEDHGHLLGVTLRQLQLIWFLFALSTWSTTAYLYRWICGQWPLNMSGFFRRSAASNPGS